jgi:predicted transcriptional regulator of viral defense system
MPTFSKDQLTIEQRSLVEKLERSGVGSLFTPSRLEEEGIRYDQLQRLVKVGLVEKVGRGLYRSETAEITEEYSLALACARSPGAIVCLLSALQVYGIGTQLPREVWLAIPHKARPPRIPEVPVRILRFSGKALTYGVVDKSFEGVPARITSPARTIVDCFRFERLIGREAAMEAVKDALRRNLVTVDALNRTLEALPSRLLVSAMETLLQ